VFIDEFKQVFGVEPICRVLTGHGLKIATSTYYAAKSRPPSARSLRDAEPKQRIHASTPTTTASTEPARSGGSCTAKASPRPAARSSN